MCTLDQEYTDNEAQAMMQMLDLSKDGHISFGEFKKVFVGDTKILAMF